MIFNEVEYFPILIAAIREDQVVPFSCYIYLKVNHRVVRLVQAGEAFEKTKIERLKTFNIDQIYISEGDRDAYAKYLREFFETPEGKVKLQELVESNPGATAIEGIPEEIASEVLAPTDQPVMEGDAAFVATESEPEPEVQAARQATEEGSVRVEGTPEEAPGTVEVAGGDEEDPYGRVIRILTGQAEELHENLKGRTDLTEEDRILIRDVTQKINLELTRVKSRRALGQRGARHVVRDVVEKINDQLVRVNGIVNKEGRLYDVLRSHVQSVKKRIEPLQKVASIQGDELLTGPEVTVVPRVTQILKDQILEIQHLVDPNETGIVSDTVNHIIDNLEKVLGADISIRTRGASDEARPSGTVTSEDSGGDSGSSGAVRVETPEELRKRIREQAQLIRDLRKRLEISRKHYSVLRSDLELLQNKVRKKIGHEEKMSFKAIDLQLKEVETATLSVNHQAQAISEKSVELQKEAGIDPDEEPADAASAGTQAAAAAYEAQQAAASVQVPEESNEDDDIETIRSENKVLRSQLLNAKNLLEKNSDKLKELTSHLDQTSPYIESLEKENSEIRKTLEKAQEQLQVTERQNIGLTEVAESAQKIASKAKYVLQERDQMLQQTRERLDAAQRELDLFKSQFAQVPAAAPDQTPNYEELPVNADYIALLKSKDQQLNKLMQDYDAQANVLKKYEKDVMQLRSKIEDTSLLKKRMGQRVERLNADKENIRRECQALDRRLTIASNLLDKERKTIARLTQLADELKKDRVQFMSQTTAAMKNYKEILSKANSLNNSVQSEMQKNRKLHDQTEGLKKKTRELGAKLTEQQELVKTLEAENRKLTFELKRLREESDAA